jgi:hypothetical protein
MTRFRKAHVAGGTRGTVSATSVAGARTGISISERWQQGEATNGKFEPRPECTIL